MKTEDAIKHLEKELKGDKEYRETWKANIAMAYVDSVLLYKKKTKKNVLSASDLHIVANNASERFLGLLCNEVKYPKGR